MLQKCVITGTHLCWSREWWKDVCLFLASRGHSLTVKSLKSDNQSLFLLQYMIYKTLQSFKQPNLRSQFCGDQKKLCLAFLAPYNPQGWGRKGVTECFSSCKLHGSHLQPMVLRWQEWVELPKHEIGLKWWRSVFLWDQATSENTNSSLFPVAIWSVPLFFILLFSCLETKTYLYYYPWVFHLTKCHQALCSKFLKWRGQNASLAIPPDCEIQSTMTYPVPFWRCSQVTVSQGHSAAAGSAVQWWTLQFNHPSVATSWNHFSIPLNG